MKSKRLGYGFTIVELLIVVVVIAILAAITLIAYNGIRDRALSSALKSEFVQAAKAIEAQRSQSATSTYPSSLPSNLQTNTAYSYYAAVNNAQGYCLVRTANGQSNFITNSSTTPAPGSCEGLVGWWPLNGESRDLSGFGEDGSINNGVATTGQNGQTGSAIQFNGTSGGVVYANATPNSQLKPTLPITYSAWVKLSTISGANQVIFSNDMHYCGGANLYNGVKLYVADGGYATIVLGNGGGCSSPSRVTYATTNSVVGVNQWVHIAATFDSNRVGKIYINGNDVAVGTTGTATSLNYTTTPSRLGMNTDGTDPIKGAVDDMRVFSRLLGLSEIQALYVAGAQ